LTSILSEDIFIDEATVQLIQGDGSLYQVVAIQVDSINTPKGDLEDIIVGTFTITDHGGLYYVWVDRTLQWRDDMALVMAIRYRQIEDVYAYPV
jgi:hypothetical protein